MEYTDPSREIPRYADRAEQENIDDLATFYAIMKATELLDSAYTKGMVNASTYEKECQTLIGHFDMQERTLKAKGAITDTAGFMREYEVPLTRAFHRLVTDKVPQTVKYRSAGEAGTAKLVMDVTALFITAGDSVRLGMVAKDDLFPYARDILATMQKIPTLPPDHSAKARVAEWLQTFNGMSAADVLSEEQQRQFTFDFEQAYSAFKEHFDLGSGR